MLHMRIKFSSGWLIKNAYCRPDSRQLPNMRLERQSFEPQEKLSVKLLCLINEPNENGTTNNRPQAPFMVVKKY